jgi:DNA-binding transcriptional ArsR family regulator
MTSLDHTLSALADSTRRSVVELLKDGPRRAGDLADELHVSRPAMSRHLKVLRGSGLVEEEARGEDGRVRAYRLRAAPFDELRAWVEGVETFWAGQLGAFKNHAEKARTKAKRR